MSLHADREKPQFAILCKSSTGILSVQTDGKVAPLSTLR
jgi:hypothetical protein